MWNLIGWSTCMFIADHKLIIIIVKSANSCINCIYGKSFWPAYSQLGMLGAIFSKVPAVALTATVTEQTKYINFPWNGGSRNHCSEPQLAEGIFYTCSTRPHTGDEIIKVLLLLYTAKLQIWEMMPPAVIYSNLFTYCHCGHCILTI